MSEIIAGFQPLSAKEKAPETIKNEDFGFDFSNLLNNESEHSVSDNGIDSSKAVSHFDVISTEKLLQNRQVIKLSKEKNINKILNKKTSEDKDYMSMFSDGLLSKGADDSAISQLIAPNIFYSSVAIGKIVFSSQITSNVIEELVVEKMSIDNVVLEGSNVKLSPNLLSLTSNQKANRLSVLTSEATPLQVVSNISARETSSDKTESNHLVQRFLVTFNVDEFQKRHLFTQQYDGEIKVYYRDYSFKGSVSKVKSDILNLINLYDRPISFKFNGNYI